QPSRRITVWAVTARHHHPTSHDRTGGNGPQRVRPTRNSTDPAVYRVGLVDMGHYLRGVIRYVPCGRITVHRNVGTYQTTPHAPLWLLFVPATRVRCYAARPSTSARSASSRRAGRVDTRRRVVAVRSCNTRTLLRRQTFHIRTTRLSGRAG